MESPRWGRRWSGSAVWGRLVGVGFLGLSGFGRLAGVGWLELVCRSDLVGQPIGWLVGWLGMVRWWVDQARSVVWAWDRVGLGSVRLGGGSAWGRFGLG